MTPRRLTFQLTPLLDLLLIVIFAQFLDVRDTTENQEQASSTQVKDLESDRDETTADLATLQAKHDRLSKELDETEKRLDASRLANQDLAARAFALKEELERTGAEREAIASLYSKLFDLPEEVVQKLFTNGDRRLSDEEIEKLREKFKEFAEQKPGQSARHLLTVDEMWKRCDVWNLYIKPSGLTVVVSGDRSFQFEATTAKDFEEELYDLYTKVPPQKSLVILLLSYGNINANIYEAAIDGLPKAAERMRSDSGGKSRFESAVLGYNPTPPANAD